MQSSRLWKISRIMAPYQGPVTYPRGSSGPVAYTGQQVAEDEGMGCYQAPSLHFKLV